MPVLNVSSRALFGDLNQSPWLCGGAGALGRGHWHSPHPGCLAMSCHQVVLAQPSSTWAPLQQRETSVPWSPCACLPKAAEQAAHGAVLMVLPLPVPPALSPSQILWWQQQQHMAPSAWLRCHCKATVKTSWVTGWNWLKGHYVAFSSCFRSPVGCSHYCMPSWPKN